MRNCSDTQPPDDRCVTFRGFSVALWVGPQLSNSHGREFSAFSRGVRNLEMNVECTDYSNPTEVWPNVLATSIHRGIQGRQYRILLFLEASKTVDEALSNFNKGLQSFGWEVKNHDD